MLKIRGGVLLTPYSADENEFFTNVLTKLGISSWLNVERTHECNYEINGFGNVDYNNWEETPTDCENNPYAVMKNDGKWTTADETETRPYIIEFSKPEYSVERSADNKSVTISLNNRFNGCSEIRPEQSGIILEYNNDIDGDGIPNYDDQ